MIKSTSHPAVPPPADPAPRRRRGSVRWFRVLGVAGIMLALVVLADQSSRASMIQPHAFMHRVTAPLGQRASVSLPDGSKVLLGPGSSLTYPDKFVRRREVHLDGEAYFQIVPQPEQPFLVRLDQRPMNKFGAGLWRKTLHDSDGEPVFLRAGERLGQDLRSEFIVRSYPEDRYPRVAVRIGYVALGDSIVPPGKLGWLSADGLPAIQPADTASWFSWTYGKLMFTATFRDAMPRLSRWYNVDLRLTDSASGDALLVASLPDSLTEEGNGLDAVALALGLRLTRHGRIVTFYRKTATPPVRRR